MKYLEIDQENDKALAVLCDAALKSQGLQVLPFVNQIVSAVKERD